MKTCCPSLYQINTRAWLTDLAHRLGRPATLDDVSDAELDRLAELGFDWIWLMSVWRTGQAGQQVSRAHPEWRKEFEATLPDLKEEDIAGSGFAITGYTVHSGLGGEKALARLRARLKDRGLRLMLDFVPNHTALDHPWVEEHPEYFIAGTEADLAREPRNYTRVRRSESELILAHGRDPYFDGWPDTLQLDYSNPATQAAMQEALQQIAPVCDGARCDMAMLLLPEVFQRTWGRLMAPFWSRTTGLIHGAYPDFVFLAEVYWDLEWTLQQQGFDYTYDKQLYDRLVAGVARPVRDHLQAGLDFQNKLARFLENHDESRAAATFRPEVHQAAAVLAYLSPGLRFFHHGQLEGRQKRLSPHLARAPEEAINEVLSHFYARLLAVLRAPTVREGQWRLAECSPAWEGNWTVECFLAFTWVGPGPDYYLVAVNYAPHQSQCYVRLPYLDLSAGLVRLKDLMGPAEYGRAGESMVSQGLYLDLPPWGYHVFALAKAPTSTLSGSGFAANHPLMNPESSGTANHCSRTPPS